MHTVEFAPLSQIKMQRGANGKRGDIITTFDSMAELIATAQNSYVGVHKTQDGEKDSWAGDEWSTTIDKLTNGDMDSVEASDKLMSKLEDIVGFETRSFQTINDVVGGVPNVGAFLSGNPANMRRRNRVAAEQAPLNIILELGASAGIKAENLVKRGAAILALVRILAARRPINLYACAAFFIDGARPSGRSSSGFAMRVETTPLDLARAAYLLTAPSILRRIAFTVLTRQDCPGQEHGSLPFPYCNIEGYRANIHAFWSRITPAEEALVVAPLYLTDNFDNPLAWVKETVAKYGANPE